MKDSVAVLTKEANKGNFVRNKTDFVWLAFFLLCMYGAGEYLWPQRSTAVDIAGFKTLLNPLNLTQPWQIWATWTAITSFSLTAITTAMWYGFKWASPAHTPDTYLEDQLKAIRVNFILLPCMQAIGDWLIVQGYTKTTMGNTAPALVVRDMLLWMLCFEIAWYTQHRAMHDNKFLWRIGHSYHHGWKRPVHMIGVTNFAFDHVVEIWVTMSSSFLGYLLFPVNFYSGKLVSLGYMVLAVLAHWDGFASRYHLNHHYLVTKNYGSHVPIFDMFFGTYQWEPFVHSDTKAAQSEAAEAQTSTKVASSRRVAVSGVTRSGQKLSGPRSSER